MEIESTLKLDPGKADKGYLATERQPIGLMPLVARSRGRMRQIQAYGSLRPSWL
jgi:hypothetical protein